MRRQFLAGAEVVRSAVSDPRVAAAWDDESILEGQSVGSLAGHLARGSVWVVDDYLDGDVPTGPVDFETAAEYFATIIDGLSDRDHRAIRDRGAAIAATGHAAVNDELGSRLDALRTRLPSEPADRQLSVVGGNVMRLDDYLWTRIVEQVVHLDDLARSLDVEPWVHPPDAAALVVSCGAETGRRRFGDAAMIRAIYRGDTAAIPVLG